MSVPLQQLVTSQLELIYLNVPGEIANNPESGNTTDIDLLAIELIEMMRLHPDSPGPEPYSNNWSERDIIAISYADSLKAQDSKPLQTLKHFLTSHVNGLINGVHILPFFPYTSDDGFAVSDYTQVRSDLGEWQDIELLSRNFRVMGDLVINHCSASHEWFTQFIADELPGRNYFYTCDTRADLTQVTRPRTSPLLRPTETRNGLRHVWCTFGHDQVDLDFRNPNVLKEFIGIVRQYLDRGISIFRLDAIAFLWKQPGTTSLNLTQTHEIVRLLRTLIEHANHEAIIITETNIPNIENLSYFGNANEAHCIYNFSLPPLLLYTLIFGNSHYLKLWMMSMPPARNGTTYFNFIASHDGIGLRPTQGILAEDDVNALTELMQDFGGRVSYRALEHGKSQPYEINISLFDAMRGTIEGGDSFQIDRFICAHTIMLALEGIPGIYIHSLLATGNDYQKCEATGANRALNRHQWDYEKLSEALATEGNVHRGVFEKIKSLIAIRIRQPAFHPNATQFTLHFGDSLFGFWRQSLDRTQSIFCISNVTNREQKLPVSQVNLIVTDQWQDLISGIAFDDHTATISMAPYQTLWISNQF